MMARRTSRREPAQGRKARLEKERAEKERKRRTMLVRAGALAAVLVVVVAAAYVLLSDRGGRGGYASTDAGDLQVTADEVLIPVSSITTSAKFSTVDIGGTAVRFFGIKGADGQVHVAADACDVCYANHKGYRQSGDGMQCNNCGQTFKINSIGTKNVAGGCWPSYLPMKIEGGKAVIQKSDLAGKAFMFG